MPNVQEGIEEAGMEPVDSDAAFNARVESRIAGSSGGDSGLSAEQISEARRYERMRAGSRTQSLAATPADRHTADQIKASVLSEDNATPSVQTELSREPQPER